MVEEAPVARLDSADSSFSGRNYTGSFQLAVHSPCYHPEISMLVLGLSNHNSTGLSRDDISLIRKIHTVRIMSKTDNIYRYAAFYLLGIIVEGQCIRDNIVVDEHSSSIVLSIENVERSSHLLNIKYLPIITANDVFTYSWRRKNDSN